MVTNDNKLKNDLQFILFKCGLFSVGESEEIADVLAPIAETYDNGIPKEMCLKWALFDKLGIKHNETLYDIFCRDLVHCINSLPPLEDPRNTYDMRSPRHEDIFPIPTTEREFREIFECIVEKGGFQNYNFFFDFYENDNTSRIPSAEYIDICYQPKESMELLTDINWDELVKPLIDVLNEYKNNGLVSNYEMQSPKNNDGVPRFIIILENDKVYNNLNSLTIAQSIFNENNFEEGDGYTENQQNYGYVYFDQLYPTTETISKLVDTLKCTLNEYLKVLGDEKPLIDFKGECERHKGTPLGEIDKSSFLYDMINNPDDGMDITLSVLYKDKEGKRLNVSNVEPYNAYNGDLWNDYYNISKEDLKTALLEILFNPNVVKFNISKYVGPDNGYDYEEDFIIASFNRDELKL